MSDPFESLPKAPPKIRKVAEVSAENSIDFSKPRRGSVSLSVDLMRIDRLPPHALEAEQGVIGSILLEPTASFDLCIEKMHDGELSFYDLRHQCLYGKLLEMWDARERIDIITVQQKLKDAGVLDGVGGLAYLSSLMDSVPSAANLSYYLDIVCEKLTLRKLLKSCTQVVATIHEHSGPASTLVDEVEREISAIRGGGDSKQTKPIKELVRDSIDSIQRWHQRQGQIGGIPTGLHDLDKLTDGLHAGELIILAARPSVGKSSMLMNIIENATVDLGLPAAVFSLEMTAESLTVRMLCGRARLNGRSVQQGFLTEGDFKKLTNCAGKICKAPLFIDDTGGLTIQQLRARARRMHQRHGLKLIAVDYLQLVSSKSERRGDNRQQEISDVSAGLKMMAKELNIPVIALCQLGRDVEKRKEPTPKLSDLRESGCLSASTTKLLTASGVQCNLSSRMNTYSLNSTGAVVVRPSKNIPKPVKSMVRLVLKSGRFIDCTPCHPILTDRGFVSAGKITKDHSIASVRKISEPKGLKYIPESKWIGWMLGNGSMTGYSSPSFICSCPVVAEGFKSETIKHFGIVPKPHRHSCKKVFQYDITASSVRTAEGNRCKNWLRSHDLWGRRSQEKIIPQWFLEQADNKSIAELVSGLFETDGTATKNSVKYSTTSNQMAWQVVWCLCRLGIFCYIDNGFMSDKANFPCFTIRISDGRDVLRFKKTVPMIGRKRDKLNEFKLSQDGSNHGDRIGVWAQAEILKVKNLYRMPWKDFGYRVQWKRISQDDLGKLIGMYPELEKLSHLVSPSIYWDQMESVSKIDDGEVFDREVAGGPHNFVANGIIVHNSLEQDADVVAMLYRTNEGDDSESDSVAVNLLIAKQRNGPAGVDVPLIFRKSMTRFESASPIKE